VLICVFAQGIRDTGKLSIFSLVLEIVGVHTAVLNKEVSVNIGA